jgi:hypothetical protein
MPVGSVSIKGIMHKCSREIESQISYLQASLRYKSDSKHTSRASLDSKSTRSAKHAVIRKDACAQRVHILHDITCTNMIHELEKYL